MVVRAGVVLVALGMLACDGGNASRAGDTGAGGTEPEAVAPAARAALDSGNAAFRARNYHEALAQYQKSVQHAPEYASAWFGIYMAQEKLGNKAAADSAMRRVQELAPQMPSSHPAEGGMPQGHPSSTDTGGR